MDQDDSVAALKQEIRRLQKRISELEQFELIAEGVQDLISVRDAQGAIEYNNPAHERIFGSLEALRGTDMFEMIHPEDRAKIEQLFRETVRSGVAQGARFRVVARDNSVRFLQSRGNLIRDSAGKVAKVIVASHDVTELTTALEELEERNRESEALNDLAASLYLSDSPKATEILFRQSQPHLLAGTSGGVFLFNNESDRYEQAFSWGDPTYSESDFKYAQCRAATSGRVHQFDDASTGLVCGHLPASIGGPYLCAHATIGLEKTSLVLHIQFSKALVSSKRPDELIRWRKRQSALAVSISNHLASSLGAQRLRARLEREAMTDELTGLYNRRYMDTELHRELQRHTRHERVLAAVLGDIDFFKRINDRNGHQTGDQVLQRVAGFLREKIRKTDVACRYGGEEFMLIMVDSTREGIRTRVEQLRKGIKALESGSDGKTLPRITLSLGIAFYPDHGNSVEDLKRAADAGLYRAKLQGRDQVVVLRTAHQSADGQAPA